MTISRYFMTNKQLLALLESKNACMCALKWVNGKGAKSAWEKCNRPDWLFWICGQLGVERKQIVLAACKCARLALKFVKKGEDRPRICIETTEAWCAGKATVEEVRKAKTEARAAAFSAAFSADAADASDAADARIKMRKQCCDEIRKAISFKELLKLAKDL